MSDIRTGFLPGPASTAPPPPGNLVWEENFDGTSLDTSRWSVPGSTFNYGFRSDGTRQGEACAHVTSIDAIVVSGGTLKINATKGSYGPTNGFWLTQTSGEVPAPWRSASIHSNIGSGINWKYGQRLEARVNCQPGVVGTRPAFWAANVGGYPGAEAADSDGEIDILEWFQKTGRNHYNVIWDYSPFKQNPFEAPASDATYGGWHTYAAEWDDQIRFYMDGVLMRTTSTWATTHSSGGPPTFPHPFHSTAVMDVRLSHQIGGRYSSYSWVTSIGDSTVNNPPVNPAISACTLECDWMRCYSL